MQGPSADAREDDRIGVVRLSENVGLGHARNVGLDEAKGRYVWFLDSDDWLEPGALQAIDDRLKATSAGVLIFGWQRVESTVIAVPGGRQHLLTEAPESFALRDWPDIIGVSQYAWNKVVKRDLLEREDIRFFAGRYQDIPFTYPALAAAKKISTLERVCVSYRQHSSQPTRLESDGHFDALAQWGRALAQVKKIVPDCPIIEAALFSKMVEHCFFVLQQNRLPRRSRKAFFQRLVAQYRDCAPEAGYDCPAAREACGIGLPAALPSRLFGRSCSCVPCVCRLFGGQKAGLGCYTYKTSDPIVVRVDIVARVAPALEMTCVS